MPEYFASRADCAHHSIFPGVDLFTLSGKTMTVSLVQMKPHSVIGAHSHPHEQMGMLLEGELTFTIGDQTQVIAAGQMWRIPGGVTHQVVAGEEGARALDVFHPVREDYR